MPAGGSCPSRPSSATAVGCPRAGTDEASMEGRLRRAPSRRTMRSTLPVEGSGSRPGSSPMETTGGLPRRGRPSEIFALASALASALAASAGALPAFARPGGDDIIDAQNHYRGVRGRGDRLSPDADRLDPALLPPFRAL